MQGIIGHGKNSNFNITCNANTGQCSKVKRKIEYGSNLFKNLFWLQFKSNILQGEVTAAG